MSKTYNLTATLNTGRLRKTDWISDNWTNFYTWNEESSNRGYAGQDDPWYYATNMIFDSSTLATLRNKTVTAVTLEVNVTQAMTGESYIAYKYNSTASGSSSSGAWTRSVNGGSSPSASADSIAYTIPAQSLSTGTKTFTLKTAVPVYGLVAGPRDTVNGRWRFDSAVLHVTTNETDYNYTLAYNANGGSGAPSSQTGSNTGTSPYYTFTVSSTVPTRTGYTFLGWSTSSSATSASYVGGNSFTVTSSGTTTLYAVWKIITYTVSYNANGGSGAPSAQTKTYNVSLTLSSTVPTRTGYIFQGWATSSTGAVAYQPSGSYTANADVILYAIWKAANSTLSSVDNTNIGSSGTASWNKIDNSYTYKLVLTYSNAPAVTVNVAANNASTSFTIPTTWYAYLPNSTSATATATLTTYSGSTALGTSTKTFTVYVASSIKPSISAFTAAPRSSNTTVSGWNVYVQGYSYVYLSATASAGTGASIVSYAFSGAGLSQTGTSTTANSTVIDSSGSKTYTLVVTDSRGRTASSTVSANFLAYSNPVVSSLTSYRSNSSGAQASIDGTYIHSTAVYSYSAVGSNSLTVKKIEYKLHTASSWTTGVSSATSGTGYTFGGGNIAITSSYDVKCTVTDSLGNSGTYTVLVPPIVGFAVGLNNDRARFGGPVEKAGLQVDWDAEFNGVLDVTKRRCYALLSSAGWYRVCKITNIGIGIYSFALDLNICRQFYSENNEQHGIRLIANFDSYSFVNENSKSNTQIITKIRYIRDSNTNGYVDIYYDLSNANIVYCEFAAHGFYPNLYTIESLQPVGPSPSGETVQTEYTFAENTITDISSIFTLNTSGISGLTGKIHAIYDASSGLVHLNFSAYTGSATFGISTPIFTCSNSRYAPKATTYGNGMIRVDNGEWIPYEISIGITGNIFQRLTADATRVYGQITYPV